MDVCSLLCVVNMCLTAVLSLLCDIVFLQAHVLTFLFCVTLFSSKHMS